MTWRLSEIKEAFDAGNNGKNSHMLVALDTFDYENYPIYVERGQDPWKQLPTNGSDRVDECYSYDIPWEIQAAEPRSNHWTHDS